MIIADLWRFDWDLIPYFIADPNPTLCHPYFYARVEKFPYNLGIFRKIAKLASLKQVPSFIV